MARILVVDDQKPIRSMLRQTLEREGHEVVEAPDGEVALEVFRADPTDLLITDIVMPNKEGIEIIMELRRDFPDLAIIAISGGGRIGPEAYLDTAERLGAAKGLAKPISTSELLGAVREVLGEG